MALTLEHLSQINGKSGRIGWIQLQEKLLPVQPSLFAGQITPAREKKPRNGSTDSTGGSHWHNLLSFYLKTTPQPVGTEKKKKEKEKMALLEVSS